MSSSQLLQPPAPILITDTRPSHGRRVSFSLDPRAPAELMMKRRSLTVTALPVSSQMSQAYCFQDPDAVLHSLDSSRDSPPHPRTHSQPRIRQSQSMPGRTGLTSHQPPRRKVRASQALQTPLPQKPKQPKPKTEKQYTPRSTRSVILSSLHLGPITSSPVLPSSTQELAAPMTSVSSSSSGSETEKKGRPRGLSLTRLLSGTSLSKDPTPAASTMSQSPSYTLSLSGITAPPSTPAVDGSVAPSIQVFGTKFLSKLVARKSNGPTPSPSSREPVPDQPSGSDSSGGEEDEEADTATLEDRRGGRFLALYRV